MYITVIRSVANVVAKRTSIHTALFFSSASHLLGKAPKQKMASSQDNVLRRTDEIVKSSEDNRVYRGLVLGNRMKVLLVSDPTTDKSAASLDVNVGYMCDPDDVPGLAHFCEHMLFLGTEKYPNENDYSKYLSENGGASNAVTYADHTKYYFDILPEHLPGALDRFAQFFLAPLFTEDATERELNAVNSEHEKNIPSDGWRMDQLDKHTAKKDHVYHKFGTGNKMTLETVPASKGISVRDELLRFHSTWYSSNIMALAVLGKESLDELEEMVVNLFSAVEDKNVTALTWEEHPFGEEQFKTCTYMVPIKDVRNLNILFPSPDLTDHYKSSPAGYITNLIGHEGPGSILAVLKSRGWSNSLAAGYKQPNRGTAFFGVSLDLTEEGIEHTDEIITLIFQYLNMLRQTGPQWWSHEEQMNLSSINFRFKDKESPRNYISSLVHNLQDYPMEHVLCNYYLLTEWEPEIIMNLLEDMMPDKVRIAIIAKKFEGQTTSKEPWYGTDYKTFPIHQEKLKTWANCGLCDELRMPDKNEFIPETLDLYPPDTDITEHPVIIKDTAISRVWFKQDDKFMLPKNIIMFDFVSPLAYLDPLNCNLTKMLASLFRDALNEYSYAAELAGLKWDLTCSKNGLVLSIGGYDNKQDILLTKIMDKLISFTIDPKRFEVYKELYIRSLNNFAAEQPYQHAVYYLDNLLTEQSWTKGELLAAMPQVTIERLEAFIPQLLSKLHIESLTHGNVNKQKALDLVGIVEDQLCSAFNMSPLLPSQLLLQRELKLENGCNYLYEVQNHVHKLSCVEIYYQCGMQTREKNVMLELLARIIQEPCFNVLRTQEQLGYIVFSGVRKSSGVQGLRVIVQSERHPNYIDQRIEEFIKSMSAYITNMSEEDFLKHREALAAHRLEKPKQLAMQTYLFWAEITAQQYHFDRANVEVAHLRTITKDDIIECYNQLIKENGDKRRKIGVHVLSMAEGGAGKTQETIEKPKDAGQIHDVTVFKSAHGMYPLVQPYINITRKGERSKL